MSKTIYEILEETNPSYMDVYYSKVLSIIENKFKNLHLWNTINTLWIIVLTIVILSHI